MHLCGVLFLLEDYSHGFGGQYGVESEKQDKSAVGFDHQERLSQHESQKGIQHINTWKNDHIC